MKLFRNPEIKREILYYIIVYLAGAVLAFRQLGGKGAGIVLPAGAAALVLPFVFYGETLPADRTDVRKDGQYSA